SADMPVMLTGRLCCPTSAMAAPFQCAAQDLDSRGNGRHAGQLVVVQVEFGALPLLYLVEQPGELHGVDALVQLLRRPLAIRRQQFEHVLPVQPVHGAHAEWPPVWVSAARRVISATSSPRVINANCSVSSSSILTPYVSSTCTARSARARDSR